MRAAVPLVGLAAAAGAVLAWLADDARAPAPTKSSRTESSTACGPSAADSPYPGMAFVPAATFTMGADTTFPEEGPAMSATVDGFWIDRTEVTNAQFAAFVAATGYRTLAERGVRLSDEPDALAVPGSAVFRPQSEGGGFRGLESWWTFVPGASWREPEGPGSSISGREAHPVVHIAFEDAVAYAAWAGRSLPTEAEFELAAQTSARRDAAGSHTANTWQGVFPVHNQPADGHAGSAPVACYAANALGLYDLIGNAWEWTASAYYPRHDFAAKNDYPDGFDPNQPGDRVAVLKGGSFLCAPEYCMRYRPQARIGQSVGLGASHIGFRTVLRP